MINLFDSLQARGIYKYSINKKKLVIPKKMKSATRLTDYTKPAQSED